MRKCEVTPHGEPHAACTGRFRVFPRLSDNRGAEPPYEDIVIAMSCQWPGATNRHTPPAPSGLSPNVDLWQSCESAALWGGDAQ